MAKSGIVTGVVALILGVAIGVVGLLAASSSLAPSPEKATSLVNQKLDNDTKPPTVYGDK